MDSRKQLDLDTNYMHLALRLARATSGLASPNPQVGCVLVRAGQVLAQGAHLYDLFDHAEIAALKQASAAGVNVAGATAYVTLEPCSHHGRTGPCADALIHAGVRRLVAATTDPNPLVTGRGIARLRAAGIEITLGVCEAEARQLNDAFAAFIRTRLPLVTLKAALSADGMLAPPLVSRTTTGPHWLTGPEARAQVHRMRHSADAILTGIGTVLADDPLLTDRTGLDRRRPLLRVVLDTHLRLPPGSHLVRSANADLLVVCAPRAAEQRAIALRAAGVEVLRFPEDHAQLPLTAILAELGSRNVLDLLLECGSQLNGAFLARGLVDKVALFYSQSELGPGAVPFAAAPFAAAPFAAAPFAAAPFAAAPSAAAPSAPASISPFLLEHALHGVTRTPFGSNIRVAGYLRDPWGPPAPPSQPD